MLSDNAGRPKTKKAFYNFLLQMNYPWKTETFCTFIAFLIYTNTFNAGFVFDDNRAIIENADVLGINPLYNLFLNDFWGTPLNHSGSHGSYRPITVLTFRINYLLFALEPGPYHVTNVVLHSLTTFLLCYVVKWILKLSTSKTFCAGMMFALHPVHTEAVSGVVGRADVMATMFSLAALIFYYKWCNCMDCAEKSSSDEDGEKVVQCGRFVQTLTHRATKSNKKKPKNRPIRAMTATTSKQTAKMEKSASHSEHISADGNVEAKHKTGSRLAANYSSDAIQANTDAYDGVSSTASYDSEASHFEETFKSNCEFAMGKSETTDASFKVKNRNRKFMNSDAKSVYASSTSPDEVKPISTIQNSANDESGFSKSSRSPFPKRYYLIISFFLCAVLALLSKEQGYCAPLLCAAYDLYIRNKLGVKESISALCLQEKRFRPLRRRIFTIFLFILIMMSFRLGLPVVLSGGKYMVPTFSPSDNPAAANESLLTRTLTFNYLLFCNFWLLICPRTLSFDWSMDAIPLISDISDSRNFLTLAFYFGLFCVAKYLWKSLMNVDQSKESSPHLNCTSNQPTQNRAQSRRRLSTSSEDNDLYHTHCDGNDWNNNSKLSKRTRDLKQTSLRRRRGLTELLIERRFELGTNPQFDATLLSTCFLTFSFLPASNLFFYVGFVLAERLLYMPSVGFCIIATDVIFHHLPKDIDFFKLFRSFLANIISVERRHRSTERLSTWIKVLVLLLYISSFAIKTWSRNYDWKDEMTIYSAGVAVNPAKALGNLGNALREQGKVEAAENAYIEALQKRPNMADVYYNLGVLYQELGRHQMAEENYKKAIQFKPRFALAHLNLGVVVSLQGRKKEAKLIYRSAANLDETGLKDPKRHAHAQISALYNLGNELADENKHDEAISVYMEAVKFPMDLYKPHSLYNMLGQSLYRVGRFEEAERWFKASLTEKPDHVPAFLTYAKLLSRIGRSDKANNYYQRALHLKDNCDVYQHYGAFLSAAGKHAEAVTLTEQGLGVCGSKDYMSLLAAANVHRQAKSYEKAKDYYRSTIKLQPNIASAHMNLGAILHLQGFYVEAKKCYLKALQHKPGDVIITENLSKLERILSTSKK